VTFGVFVVRMRGVSFALLTLAFNQLIYVTAEKWRTVTGGEDGIAFMRPNLQLGGWEIDLWATPELVLLCFTGDSDLHRLFCGT
jgi:ABC-type branched-subunit amino acid transport system permease subunit